MFVTVAEVASSAVIVPRVKGMNVTLRSSSSVKRLYVPLSAR